MVRQLMATQHKRQSSLPSVEPDATYTPPILLYITIGANVTVCARYYSINNSCPLNYAGGQPNITIRALGPSTTCSTIYYSLRNATGTFSATYSGYAVCDNTTSSKSSAATTSTSMSVSALSLLLSFVVIEMSLLVV